MADTTVPSVERATNGDSDKFAQMARERESPHRRVVPARASGSGRYICTMNQRFISILAVVAGASGCGGDAPLRGMVVDPPQEAPVVRVMGADGAMFDLDKERGSRTVMLFFGYTHCPDVCPATLADWARAKKALGSGADGVRFVFVSVDPERDTPQVAHDYARQFDASFIGLSPTAAQVDSLKASWGFTVMRDSTAEMKRGEYGVIHPAGSFVIDRRGRIREIFPPETRTDDIVADLRRIR